MRLSLIMFLLVLTGCTQTIGSIDTRTIVPDRPQAIICPPSGLKKVSPDVYQTNQQGADNLKICLNNVVKYVDETNSLYEFFVNPKKK